MYPLQTNTLIDKTDLTLTKKLFSFVIFLEITQGSTFVFITNHKIDDLYICCFADSNTFCMRKNPPVFK